MSKYYFEILIACALAKALALPEWPTTVALTIFVMAYVVTQYGDSMAEASKVDLEPIYAKLEALTIASEALRFQQDKSEKALEEAQRLLNNTNLGVAFRPTKKM